MSENKQVPTQNLRLETHPYFHLRDDEGCVLAADYCHFGKLNFILSAVAAAPSMLEALKLAQTIIGHPDDDGSKFIAEVIAKAEGAEDER